ncbi:efflux RND transporter periplasmic adaptor subunit [Marinobacter sp. JSM 1782161]|uniref:efflux RND transporter periplasmic adaptor subunit n=1 Tax=Marinobacter sp. JSM 1782161 TaxID=2685906 RepID=UPI001402FF4D|nr:HlyD family efflux transporter periplasmic adaptor subunit [Marinobacter sp. JSM 1782161]
MDTSGRKRYLLPLLLVVIASAVIALLVATRPSPPETPAAEKSWPVQAATIESASRSPQLRLLGRIETPFQSTLSAAVTADVARLPRLEGQRVTQGDVMIELDAAEVRLLVDQREADVAELESQIEQERNQYRADQRLLERERSLVALAQRSLEREQRLSESNLNSQARMDQTREAVQAAEISLVNRELAVANHDSRLKALQARLERAQALLSQARLDLDRTRIRAPFAGVITAIDVSPGERVRPGEPLLSLYADDALEIRAQVPMPHIGPIQSALAAGQSLRATTELGGNTRPLTLQRLSGQVNRGAGGVDALFRFRGETPDAALNRTLDVILELPAQPDLFSVPVAALYDERTLFRIQEGRLESLDVEVVGTHFNSDRQHLLIRSSHLTDGDRILTTQLPNAIGGLRVDVRSPETDGD